MKKFISILLVIMTVLSIAGCSKTSNETTHIICLVTDENGLDDKYAKSAYDALNSVKNEYGFEIQTITPKDSEDYENAVLKAVDKDPVLVIVTSPNLKIETLLTSLQNLTINFCVLDSNCDLNVDGVQDSPNLYCVMTDYAQLAYVYTLYLASNSSKIALVTDGTYEISSKLELGYRYALKCLEKSDYKVITITDSMTDDEVTEALSVIDKNYAIITNLDDKRIVTRSNETSAVLLNINSSKADINIDVLVENEVKKVAMITMNGSFKGQTTKLSFGNETLKLDLNSTDFSNVEIVKKAAIALAEDKITIPTTNEALTNSKKVDFDSLELYSSNIGDIILNIINNQE